MSRSLYDSIVLVESSEPDNAYFGTSFPIYYDGQATYFSTCLHVIDHIGGPDKIVVRLKESQKDSVSPNGFPAKLIASGKPFGIDLAVLRVEGLSGLSIWPLRRNSPEQTTSFHMAGYSSPDNKHFQFDPLQGSFGPKTELGDRKATDDRIFIDAWELMFSHNNPTHVQKGHSGSPVIDESHYVIAVVTSSQEEGSKGTAISIEALKIIWEGIPPDLFIPSQVPECRIGEILARWPESVVCKGWYRNSQEQAEEQVAIKFMSLDQPTEAFPECFVRNVKTFQDNLASHKNIVALKACGVLDEERYAYLIMEYAPDKSLGDQSSAHLTSFGIRLNYILEVAEALGYAHSKDITHGNLKLSNFLLRGGSILLSDFEMLTRHAAGLVDRSSALPVLVEGRVQKAREWKDQYDLAEIAYQFLTGARSLDEGRQIVSSQYPGMAPVLKRALAPDGLDRYSSMGNFHSMLKQFRPSPADPQQPDPFVPFVPVPSDQTPRQIRPIQQPDPFVPVPKSRPLRHWLIMAVVGVLLLSGLGVGLHSYGSFVFNSQSYCLGTDFPTSSLGDSAQATLLKNGADLAIIQNHDLGSGYTLDHCDKDDTSPATHTHDPSTGEGNVNEFIPDNTVLGFIGPGNSDVAQKEIPAAASASLPMIGPYTSILCLTLQSYCNYPGQEQVHPSGAPKTFFRTCSNDLQQVQAVNRLLKSLNLQKIFVVDDSEIYGEELATIFKSQQSNGANILGYEHISANEQSPQLALLAQEIVLSQPDAVFYAGVTSNGGGRLKDQLVQAGFTGPLIGGAGIANDQQFLNDAGSSANNTYAITLGPDPSTLPSLFIHAYKSHYGGAPSTISAQSYDAAMILITAIKSLIKTNPQIMHNSDIRTIRNAVLSNVQHPEKPYEGLTGPITFDSNGDNSAVKNFITYTVQAGQWTIDQ